MIELIDVKKIFNMGQPNEFTAIRGVIQTARQMAVPLSLWNIRNSFLDACRVLPESRPWERGPYKAFAREIEIPAELIAWGAE